MFDHFSNSTSSQSHNLLQAFNYTDKKIKSQWVRAGKTKQKKTNMRKEGKLGNWHNLLVLHGKKNARGV